MVSIKKRIVSGVFALAIMASSMGMIGGTAIDNSPVNVSVSASADTVKAVEAASVANVSYISSTINGKITWGRVSSADYYIIKVRDTDNGHWRKWLTKAKVPGSKTSFDIGSLPLRIESKEMGQIVVQPARVIVQNKKKTVVYADINTAPKINLCPTSDKGSVGKSRFGTCGAALASVLSSEKEMDTSADKLLEDMYKKGYKFNVANKTWSKATNGKNELAGCKITQLRDYVSKRTNGKVKASVNTFSKYSNQQIKNAIDAKIQTNHRVIIGYRSSTSTKAEQRYMVVCANDSKTYFVYNPMNGQYMRMYKDDVVSKIKSASPEFKGMLTLN